MHLFGWVLWHLLTYSLTSFLKARQYSRLNFQCQDNARHFVSRRLRQDKMRWTKSEARQRPLLSMLRQGTSCLPKYLYHFMVPKKSKKRADAGCLMRLRLRSAVQVWFKHVISHCQEYTSNMLRFHIKLLQIRYLLAPGCCETRLGRVILWLDYCNAMLTGLPESGNAYCNLS